MKKLYLSVAAALLLSGCVSQDQADQKMERGCHAGIESLIAPATLEQVKSVNFSLENNLEGQHRRVTIDAVTKDGWLELDKTYSCLFAQQWGIFKSSHAAVLVQIRLDEGKVIGKQDGLIVGEMSDFIKLSDTVQEAMQ
jgi:hypothetical protein